MSVATDADPTAPQQGRVIAPSGRLRQADATDSERHFAIATHLSPLAWLLGVGPFALAIPVVLWMIRKDESVYNDDHGREVVNFGISFVGLHIITGITVIGFVVWPVLWVIALVNIIRGAVAAANGEYFRYPMTVRLIN